MRNNAVSLSFGYLVTKSRDREDGIRELLGIDLFEIPIVPVPANPETRILSMKGRVRPPVSVTSTPSSTRSSERSRSAGTRSIAGVTRRPARNGS